MMPDTHIIIGAAWCLIGYIAGALAMVCLFWRRLSRPCQDERRRLEQALEDAGAQVGHLYEQNLRLAGMLANGTGSVSRDRYTPTAGHGEKVT
jgi:hypothetical protein